MVKAIISYQRVFNNIVENLKKSNDVLAVLVFGSIVTGDVWEESDIDFFVVCDKNPENIENIYLEEGDIPVHIKLMNKETFMDIVDGNNKTIGFSRVFSASRLVFSRDYYITDKYNSGRYFKDVDKNRLSMVYLGNLLKELKVCKKYLYNGGNYTAFLSAVRAMEGFSKLYVNSLGYMTSKDALSMASDSNIEFKITLENLFFYKNNGEDVVKDTIDFIERGIDEIFKVSTNFLVEVLREEKKPLSAEEIKNIPIFKNFNIEIEEILKELFKRSMIKREIREYKTKEGNFLFKENSYYL
ncbi:nucleotidyltransferase domain-containing protein [Clostridium hydrogeniformans]|uniref:nucleotidyltransferase domain-containing protein n=1 Tax=Clostridium hydrogeniformans TaxID=349933 RepID=UPI000489E477|nr:nucleotidyltransferase domain-containing protein [Clostridium hydrogeniformans]